jgi:hypothetical protein
MIAAANKAGDTGLPKLSVKLTHLEVGDKYFPKFSESEKVRHREVFDVRNRWRPVVRRQPSNLESLLRASTGAGFGIYGRRIRTNIQYSIVVSHEITQEEIWRETSSLDFHADFDRRRRLCRHGTGNSHGSGGTAPR